MFYGILHTPSDTFLPTPPHRNQATWVEPGEGPPRLFLSEKDAWSALKRWLRGKSTIWYESGGEVSGNITPTSKRHPKDMRIVEVTLHWHST